MSIRIRNWHNLASLLLCIGLGLSACSSGGEGGGGGGTPAATVSGTATSPGGLLAKAAPTKLQQFFAALLPTDAWAQAIGGFAPVPGANVFLLRITNAGVPTGTPLILAQTTTNAAGQYTLTLPPGVTFSSDLVVQVTNAATPQPIPTAGTQNAPATQTTVNVNPISEEVLREVITFLGANPASTLANFSAFELSELQRVINAAVAANPSLVGTTATLTIANIQASLAPALATTIPVLASSTNFLTVLSTSLPNGTANVAYNQPILAIGNPGALSYAVTVGGLPTGLSLNNTTGQITGSPTVAGTFNFSVQVSLPAAPPSPVTRALSITLAPPAPAAVASLTPATQAIQVNAQGSLTVTLNVAQLTDTPVTLSATPGGIVTLPAGNSVQVPANQISASFPITAGLATGTTQVTAMIGASNASASVTVSVAPPPPPPPTGIERVSVDSAEIQGNGNSPPIVVGRRAPSISRDGRFIAFYSDASNLVANDTNGVADIFVRDRVTGGTSRVSVGPAGAQGVQDSVLPVISGNGRYVVFASRANLSIDDTSLTTVYDLYRHDRQTGETRLVNFFPPPSGGQFGGYTPAPNASTNNNGNLVVWSDGSFEIFVFDLTDTGLNFAGVVIPDGTILNPQVLNPVISDDGRYVAFVTNRPVIPTDTNLTFDVYLADRQTNPPTFTLVTTGMQVDLVDRVISMSADGRYVAYTTEGAIVATDTNLARDVYVFDRVSGTHQRVSVDSAGTQGTLNSRDPAISANGEFVAFSSAATTLVAGDTNARDDVFIHNRTTGQTRRLSETSSGMQGNNLSSLPSVNGDGSDTAFVSISSNLVPNDTGGFSDVFVAP